MKPSKVKKELKHRSYKINWIAAKSNKSLTRDVFQTGYKTWRDPSSAFNAQPKAPNKSRHKYSLVDFPQKSTLFISRLSMIVRENVVLNRTFVGFTLLLLTLTDVSITCAVVIFRVKASCSTPVYVFNSGYWPDWSVKLWYYWLWKLVMVLVSFDPSIVIVKQSFIIVTQIVSCPFVLS